MSYMATQVDESSDRYKETLREMKQMLIDKVKDGKQTQSKLGSTGKKTSYLPALAK